MEDNTPEYQVFTINSGRYLTLLTRKFEKRKEWKRSNPKEIYSFIPGSIIEIYAKPGQKMKAGEVILTLEAMKMYNKVEMPMDGVIKKINVKKGDRIPKNLLMVTID
jgi:biotin carboxyl carrier protein